MLHSEELLIKPLERDDLGEAYVQWLNDANINSSLATSYKPQTKETVASYWSAEAASPNAELFGIWSKQEMLHIGNIRIGEINWIHRRADLSLVIGNTSFWGKGYGTDAIRLVSKWAFTRLGLMKLGAGIAASNAGCRRAFEKAWFSLEGTQRCEIWIDGIRTDRWIMGLTYEDWKERHENSGNHTS